MSIDDRDEIDRDEEARSRQDEFESALRGMRGMMSPDFGAGAGGEYIPIRLPNSLLAMTADVDRLLQQAVSESTVSHDPQLASIPDSIPGTLGADASEFVGTGNSSGPMRDFSLDEIGESPELDVEPGQSDLVDADPMTPQEVPPPPPMAPDIDKDDLKPNAPPAEKVDQAPRGRAHIPPQARRDGLWPPGAGRRRRGPFVPDGPIEGYKGPLPPDALRMGVAGPDTGGTTNFGEALTRGMDVLPDWAKPSGHAKPMGHAAPMGGQPQIGHQPTIHTQRPFGIPEPPLGHAGSTFARPQDAGQAAVVGGGEKAVEALDGTIDKVMELLRRFSLGFERHDETIDRMLDRLDAGDPGDEF